MENLIFSLNATVPIFLLMACGILFRHLGWIDQVFAGKLNNFVFRVLLPVLMFHDLATVDFYESWNGGFVLFCFIATGISIFISFLISHVFEREVRGEFIQCSYRSSAALLGIAFTQNIYGNSGMGPMMVIGSVPLYNVMAVVILSAFGPKEAGVDKRQARKVAAGVLKNPIIIGVLTGLLWTALKIPMPAMLGSAAGMIGRAASPMGLIAMGACFDLKAVVRRKRPAVTAAILKLVGYCALFLPAAVRLGFRDQELVALLVMLGSSSTVACYVMARNMGHEGSLTSGVVMVTTLLCGFTLTFWLFLLRSAGYI